MTSEFDPTRTPSTRAPCSRMVALSADYLEERLQLHTYRSTVSLLRSLREEDLPPDLRRTLNLFLVTSN